MAAVADLVAAAKLWLVSAQAANLPYLSQGLYALVTVESYEVDTVAADEYWRLYVNPSWASEVSVEDLAKAIVHQLWHLLLEHATRARTMGVNRQTAESWRDATDLTLVDILGPAGVAEEPMIAAANDLRAKRQAALAPGRSAEEYWAVLAKLPANADSPPRGESDDEGGKPDSSEGSASDGQQRPWELPADSDIGGLEESQADLVRHAVAVRYEEALRGARGEIPGEALRWVTRITKPTLPWEHLLAQAARRGVGWTAGRTHTTYSRPNRRASSTPGVLMPGWRRPRTVVACVIDTSGSVDDELLGKAMGEVDGALRGLGVAGSDVTILACDASVHAVQRIRKVTDASLIGGGGTDMRVALAAVDRLRPRPSLTVVFTDGYTPWPENPPTGSAVVVALLVRPGQQVPPTPLWATTIRCELTL